jgi:molybdopterin/thiamine biosynthesis adenylyltransferase
MIVLVGLGTLGTRVLKRLSRYEKILAIDYDTVERENIGTQYPPIALGKKKTEAARAYIRTDIEVIDKHLDWSTAGLLEPAELVIDCTDNMLVRYVINDYCAKHGIPWIHGGISDCVGSVASIAPDGPCYQCIYPRGRGEDCTLELDTTIAERVADAVILELARVRASTSVKTRFTRIGRENLTVLDVTRRAGCPTCNETYHYLKPRDYFITYCVTAQCMSAKPVHPHHHDRGPGEEVTVDGVRCTVHRNGEIHFHKVLNDDRLHAIAEKLYRKRQATN